MHAPARSQISPPSIRLLVARWARWPSWPRWPRWPRSPAARRATRLGSGAVSVLGAGVINDPSNKSLRFDILKFGLDTFCTRNAQGWRAVEVRRRRARRGSLFRRVLRFTGARRRGAQVVRRAIHRQGLRLDQRHATPRLQLARRRGVRDRFPAQRRRHVRLLQTAPDRRRGAFKPRSWNPRWRRAGCCSRA